MIRQLLRRNTNLYEKLSIPGVDFLHDGNGGMVVDRENSEDG
jgi:hypothetical protein